jgi:hypothetical protein
MKKLKKLEKLEKKIACIGVSVEYVIQSFILKISDVNSLMRERR